MATIEPIVGTGSIVERGAEPSPPPRTCRWLDGLAMFDDREWRCEQAELQWSSPAHLIVLTRRGGTARTYVRPEGGTVHEGRDTPGTISFVPAGVARQSAYEQASLAYTAIWITPSLLGDLGDRAPPGEAMINFTDPLLRSLLVALREEAFCASPPDALYLEHMLRLCLHRVRVVQGRNGENPADRQLASPVLRRVEEFIDANLHRTIKLADLAAVAGIAPDSFARRFKATIGRPPHSHVLERRIEKAEEMLANGTQPIARLAVQLGFPNQSHFTAMFRRRRGTTPQAYRASCS